MKAPDFLPLILLLVILTGCNTMTQLSVEQDASRTASKLGTKPNDIQFLSYADFSVVTEPQLKKVIGENGTLALTDSNLYLFVHNSKFFFSRDLLTVPYTDMKGIFQVNNQIQLKYRDLMMILEIRDPEVKSPDLDKQNSFYQMIRAQGIPEFEAVEIGEITRYRRQRDRFLTRSTALPSDNTWEPSLPDD